jgi:uncharacterized repeat protein (TIGR02543 family)
MSYSTRSLTATSTGPTTATLTLAVTGASPPSFTWSVSGPGTESPASGSVGSSSLNQSIFVTGLSPGTSYSWSYTLGGAAGSASGTSNTITTGTYTVTWNANGGSVSPSSSSGKTVTAPTPTRSGFTFNGWYTAASGGSLVVSAGGSYTPSSNITLYAQWTAITYTVTWNANGGSVSPASNSGTSGTSVTAPTPTRTGYSFNGWYTASSGGSLVVSAGASYTITSTVTLYAQWTINTYTVAYNANGGTGAPTSQTKTYNVTLTLTSSTPTRTGYTFVNWNTAANGSGTSYSAGGSYTTNAAATLYAQWSINAPVWSDNTLATPVIGRAYSDGVSATNSPTYSVFSGTLPTGLSLNTSTGGVTGTVTAVGPFTFTLRASNAGGSVDQAFTSISPTGGINGRGASTWGKTTAKVYNGTTWVTATVWVYNGTSWVAST